MVNKSIRQVFGKIIKVGNHVRLIKKKREYS